MHRETWEGNGNLQQRCEICCISSFNPRRISQRSSIRALSLYTRSSDVEGGKGGSEPMRKARAREWEAGRAVGTSHSQPRGYSEPRQNCPWHKAESGCRERGVEIYSCSECARVCVSVCACVQAQALIAAHAFPEGNSCSAEGEREAEFRNLLSSPRVKKEKLTLHGR